MDTRIEKLLTEERHKLASNLNSQMNLELVSKSKPIPENNFNETVFVDEQFNIERQSSTKYRFYGNIKSFISNPLFNDNIKIYQKNTGGSLVTKVEKVDPRSIIEQDGWFGYFDDDSDTAQEYIADAQDFNDNKSSLCQLFHFDPGPDRLKFDDPDGLPNYQLKITYPYEKQDIVLVGDPDSNNSVSLKDGINIISVSGKTIGERSYTVFKTAIKHGLSQGDYIRFYNMGDFTYKKFNENDYEVFLLGDEGGQNKETSFVVDIDFSKINPSLNNNFDKKVSTFKRVVNNIPSEYYVRVFKSLTTDLKDYDMFPASYATSSFGDEEVGFNFNVDIDVNGLEDNLGRPLSELFLTIVKIDTDNDVTDFKDQYWASKIKAARTDSIPSNLVQPNGANSEPRFWTHIQGGFKTVNDTDINYNVRAISADRDITTYPNLTPIYPQVHFGKIDNGIDESDDEFVGDISEYNESELSERILEPVWHRVNTVYREYRAPIFNLSTETDDDDVEINTVRNLTEGYIYRPHYRIKIRDFSSFIETGDEKKVIGIPEYATLVYSGDTGESTIYKWRDLLDIGFYDELNRGVDYPFKSGAHYMYLDLNFFLERQDPPCENIVTQEEITLTIPASTTAQEEAEEKFNFFVRDPRFRKFEVDITGQPDLPFTGDTTSNEPGFPQVSLNVTFTFVEPVGDYPLGIREIPCDGITLSTIERVDIDDVC